MSGKLSLFVACAQQAHADLALLRRRLETTSRILRRDAARASTDPFEAGVAFGKLRGADWIDAILRGDFDGP
jgi:hypothetical protein